MPRYCPRCGESLTGHSTTKGETRITARKAYEPAKKKVKRGPSAYNKKYAAAYKRLKKKHPRMKFAAIAKKVHKAVKK